MKLRHYCLSILESRYFIACIAAIGILLRVGLIYYTAAHHNPTFADEDDYRSIGASLSRGGPYSIDGIHPSAFRPPAQPLLIALIFHLFGPHVAYVKIFEALLLAAIPFACSVMGRSLGLTVAAANVGAALAGLHPALAYASTTIYPTVLTAFALTVGLLMSVFIFNGKGNGTAAGAGLAFGLAASATTTFAPIAILAALIMAVKRRYAAALIVAVLGTLPVIAWMARNQVELGKFTVATNGGINLYVGANDLATPMSGNTLPYKLYSDVPLYHEVELDSLYRAEGVAWIRTHPGRWAGLASLRAILVFDSVGNPATRGLHSGLAAHIIGWIMLPFIVLSAIGIFFRYKLPLAWLTMAAMLLVMASSALTLMKPRFRFPCDPALCVFSVAGFMALWSRGKNPQMGSIQIGQVGSGSVQQDYSRSI